jgi:hypothetical protein
MGEPTDPAAGADNFAAGWLLACKAFLAAGAGAPDFAAVDLPPGVGSRLRRGTECLRSLLELWPSRRAPGAAAPAGADSLPDSRVGRFHVRRELGRGGFGVVYLAHDPVLDREVALKVPRADIRVDPEAGHRLAVEAQAAARLGHPNIVPVLESGTAGTTPYVVSAYCPGISLADWLQQSPAPVPWRDAVGAVAALARGVQHAHARGVLHRDLKPANVLLSLNETGPGGVAPAPPPLSAYEPLVSDFGLAKFLVESSGPHTTSGVIRGTPAYMAPEQASGRHRDVTTAVDVYALGAILYELLVRRPPFAADTPLATLDKVRSEHPTPPRALRTGLPADVETVCLKCLQKDPPGRYATAGQMADDLDRLLRGEAILARPPGPLRKLFRPIRRYPAVASLSAVLVAALVGGLVVAITLWQRTRRERDRAESNLADLLRVTEETATATVQDPGLQTDEMRPLRDKLLDESARRFAWLASRFSAEPADRLLVARCDLQLGTLLFKLGRLDEARPVATRAAAAYEGLLQERRDDSRLAFGLTFARMTLALVENHDRPDRPSVERAQEAFAAYLAVPEAVRGPATREEIQFATFQYDLAIEADRRSDREAAREYLAASCDRLRPHVAPDSPVRQHALLLLAHFLQFRCQVERFANRPDAAVAAGEEAHSRTTAIVREWPDDPEGWLKYASSCNEYGLALQQSGQQRRALDIWREGYDRLGAADAVRAAGGPASAIARHNYGRLMIAFNLALGYARRQSAADFEYWHRLSADLGRRLLFTVRNDRQLWYMHGISCANLVGIERRQGRSTEVLSLHGEAVMSLETALAMRPDDAQLRRDLGQCWERYAEDLARANKYGRALGAFVRAVTHQFAAELAMLGGPQFLDRLARHLTKSTELVDRLFKAGCRTR